MEQKAKKKGLGWVLLFLALAGGVLGFGLVHFFKDLAPIPLLLYSLLGLGFGLFLAILLHEAGHGLFGLLSGYRFLSFTVLGLVLYRRDGRFRLGRNYLSSIGGQCLMVPNKEDPGVVLYLLGGGLTNLVTGSLAFFFLGNGPMGVFFYFFGVFSWILGLSNLLPVQMAGLPTDGYNILLLRGSKVCKDAFYKILRLEALGIEGVATQGQALPIGDLDDPLVNSLAFHEISEAMEQMEMESAKKKMQALLGRKLHGIHRILLEAELHFLELYETGEAKRALAPAVLSLKLPTLLRLRAAHAVLSGKRDWKLEAFFLKVLDGCPNLVEARRERQFFEAFLARWA